MEQKSPIRIMRHLVRDRRFIGPMVLVMLGYFLVVMPMITDMPLEQLLTELGPRYLGYGLSIVGGIWLYVEFFSAYIRIRKDDSFADVDARRRERSKDVETERIIEELRELKRNQQTVDYQKIEQLINEKTDSKKRSRENQFESFENYFDSLSSLLEEQAQTADEKASILLDKGTAYSRNGILFFIATIVAWQYLALEKGFQTQHIYGIASCSLLFVFIEFLSAWFLKQYRHYVDTSTYLLKVKSIFDRYMLSFLTLNGVKTDEDVKKYSHLNALLSEDIKWPESYLLKNADMSFAKEALDAMTHMAKSMKSEAKNVRDKDVNNKSS